MIAARRIATRRILRQRGFGLVELMIALALGLLVVGGASVLFNATRQASTSNDNLSRIQESVRTSYDLMVREVREAGATPCDAQLLVSDVLVNGQGATPVWWASWGEPVHGYDGATAFPGIATGAATGERVAGTAALVVRYGTPVDGLAVASHVAATATITANRLNHGIAAGDLMMVCNYGQAAIFQASSVNLGTGAIVHANGVGTPGNCSAGLGLPTLCTATGTSYQFASGALLGRFVAAGWYIGNNGRAGTGGRSLYRITRTAIPEEVADGVRDMQLSYLVGGGADYVAAAAVADWSTVTAVRFTLTFEGPDNYASTAASAPRLRRPVDFTVNFRNLQP